MLAEIFILLLETLMSHSHPDGSPRVVSTSPHVPIQLPLESADQEPGTHGNRLDVGLMTKSELDKAIVECEEVAADPQSTGVTFVVTQVWGRKPR